MDAPEPRRCWYRRRRWRVAAATWLILPAAYVLSLGPATYYIRRGWDETVDIRAIYTPLIAASEYAGNPTYLDGYVLWWIRLADRHAAAQ